MTDTRTQILEASRALVEEEGAAVGLGRIAAEAGISRRAIYLHFESRTELLVALAAYVDESKRLSERARAFREADSGVEALEAFVALNATYNGEIYGIARAFERARETDPAAAAAWDDRMSGRRAACNRISRQLHREGALAPRWRPRTAADLLWACTNISVWRDLVIDRGWSKRRFRDEMTTLLRSALLRQ